MSQAQNSSMGALLQMYSQEKPGMLKQLENDIEKSVSPSQCFFIRLDGCTFSTFLKGVRKPFDSRITDAMVKTTADLVFKFQPTLGYTSSDEITLAFPAAIEQIFEDGSSSLSKDSASSSRKAEKKKRLEKSHAYNGRIQKLASVASGYASVRFNYHITHPADQWNDMDQVLQNRMHSGLGHFDARVVPCPNSTLLMETIFWRSNFDAFRNAISQISFSQFPAKAVHGLSVSQQLIKLQREKDMNILHDFHARYLYGTWIKRQKYSFKAVNVKTGKENDAIRTRLVCGSFNWADWNDEERVEFTMAKFWPNSFPITTTSDTDTTNAQQDASNQQIDVLGNGLMKNVPPVDLTLTEALLPHKNVSL